VPLTARVEQAGGSQLGKAGHLTRERLLEPAEEPPFSPPEPASGALPASLTAAGSTGLASQIASFTSAIAALIRAKR
jgi:hypothetical protein